MKAQYYLNVTKMAMLPATLGCDFECLLGRLFMTNPALAVCMPQLQAISVIEINLKTYDLPWSEVSVSAFVAVVTSNIKGGARSLINNMICRKFERFWQNNVDLGNTDQQSSRWFFVRKRTDLSLLVILWTLELLRKHAVKNQRDEFWGLLLAVQQLLCVS